VIFRVTAQFVKQLRHRVPLLHKLKSVHFEGRTLKTCLQQKSPVCFRYTQFAVFLHSAVWACIPYIFSGYGNNAIRRGYVIFRQVLQKFGNKFLPRCLKKSTSRYFSLYYYFLVNFLHVDSWREKRKADEEWNGFADEVKGNEGKVTDFSFQVRG
jgi:hypothetical protein